MESFLCGVRYQKLRSALLHCAAHSPWVDTLTAATVNIKNFCKFEAILHLSLQLRSTMPDVAENFGDGCSGFTIQCSSIDLTVYHMSNKAYFMLKCKS